MAKIDSVPYTLVQTSPVSTNALGRSNYLIPLTPQNLNVEAGSFYVSIYDNRTSTGGLFSSLSMTTVNTGQVGFLALP